jgi:hypothetical protein
MVAAVAGEVSFVAPSIVEAVDWILLQNHVSSATIGAPAI